MSWFDLPEAELATYRSSTPPPDDLDAFWRARIEEARAAAGELTVTRHGADVYGPLPVWDVEFSGARGDRIKAWYLRPAHRDIDEPLPTIVSYVGYGGGRGLPADHSLLPATGYAVMVMDTRGQGGSWSTGGTGDPGAGAGPEFPGVMTRGIADPLTYYYTRLFVDAVRALDAVVELPGVDASRIGVRGGSQGGGLALAAAALTDRDLRVCHADVPFLCDIARAITITDAFPYGEVAKFLAQHAGLVPAALITLGYVDVALLAPRVRATSLLSVGLMDDVCPPSTVFAAYNAISAPKEITVYPFGVHDLAHAHLELQLRHLHRHLAPHEAPGREDSA